MLKLPPIAFQKPTSESGTEGLIRWADQMMNYLHQINLSVDAEASESVEDFGWFGVPINRFFVQANPPQKLGAAQCTPSSYPVLHYLEPDVPFDRLIGIAGSENDADAATATVFAYFRIPPTYITGTNLKVRVAGHVYTSDNTIQPSLMTVGVEVRRNKPTSTQQGFYDGAWNANICNTSAQTITWEDINSFIFPDYDFDIEANDSTFPLTPGNLLKISLVGAVTGGAVNPATKDTIMLLADVRLGCKIRR